MRLVFGRIRGEIVDEPAREGEGVGGTASRSGLGLCHCAGGAESEEYRLEHGRDGVFCLKAMQSDELTGQGGWR